MKKIKKFFSSLLPKGAAKERIKLIYYNLLSKNKTTFALVKGEPLHYHTNYDGLSLITLDPLYSIADHFDFYQHYHKVQSGEIVVDAGANNGYISLLFSKLAGLSGKVYAFEPDSSNIGRIKENIALNPTLPNNIIIEDLLLWKEETMLDFHEAGTVASSAIGIPENVKTVRKQAVSIDSWVNANQLSKVDFIKMDIEGAEIEAMDGCVETIKKFKPNFAIASYHVVNGEQTYKKLEDFFSKHDYPFTTKRFNANEVITFAGRLTNG